jgi:hypothetical protein
MKQKPKVQPTTNPSMKVSIGRKGSVIFTIDLPTRRLVLDSTEAAAIHFLLNQWAINADRAAREKERAEAESRKPLFEALDKQRQDMDKQIIGLYREEAIATPEPP